MKVDQNTWFLDFSPQLISTTGSWDRLPVYLVTMVTMGPVCVMKLTRTRNQRFSVRRTSVSSVSLSQSVNSQSVSQSVNCQSMTSHCLVIASSWRQCFVLACCLFSLSPVLRTGLSLQLDGSASHWLYSFMPQSQCWRTALFTFSLASFLDQS